MGYISDCFFGLNFGWGYSGSSIKKSHFYLSYRNQMDIQKWNFKTHEYEPYNPDPQWTIKLMSGSMNEIVNCADCGTNVLYGETYTSRAIHNSVGFGYPVCGKCYQEERQEEEMN